MARAATQSSVKESAPAQTEVSPAARTMADVLTGKQNQNTGSSSAEPVNVGRATTIRNPYQGKVPTYSNAVAESAANNTPLRMVLSKLYSKFKGPKA